MREFLKCGRCHAILYDEVDSIGRLYFAHPDRPCVPVTVAVAQFFLECAICKDEVEAGPVRGQLAICSDECRALLAERRRIAQQGYSKKYRAKLARQARGEPEPEPYRQTYTPSRYKGVSIRDGSISARISINGRARHLGTFKTEREAAHVYDNAALARFGPNADLNFPTDITIIKKEVA